MGDKIVKKLTLEDIIAKKDQIRDNRAKNVEIYVKSLDGSIVAQLPDRALVADCMEFDDDMESNVHLVYNCIVEPNLKDKEAQTAFGVHTPKELLQAIISDGEIGYIAEKLMEVAGYDKGNVRLVNEIKN